MRRAYSPDGVRPAADRSVEKVGPAKMQIPYVKVEARRAATGIKRRILLPVEKLQLACRIKIVVSSNAEGGTRFNARPLAANFVLDALADGIAAEQRGADLCECGGCEHR